MIHYFVYVMHNRVLPVRARTQTNPLLCVNIRCTFTCAREVCLIVFVLHLGFYIFYTSYVNYLHIERFLWLLEERDLSRDRQRNVSNVHFTMCESTQQQKNGTRSCYLFNICACICVCACECAHLHAS